MTKRQKVAIISLILGIFALINLVWFVTMGYPYMKYESVMHPYKDEGSSIKYKYEDDKYIYSIKPAPYMGFESGFLTVSEKRKYLEYEEMCEGEKIFYHFDECDDKIIDENFRSIDFYYWRKPTKPSKYGIMYYGKDLNAQILFDSEFNVLNGEDCGYQSEFQAVIDEEREVIKDMMDHAKDLWGLEY